MSVIGWMWAATGAWAAGGPAGGPWWIGEWGLDPSRSDDPSAAIERAYVGPTVVGQDARGYSPDGGEIDVDAGRRKLLHELLGVLGVSGRLSLAPGANDGALALAWGGGQPIPLELGRRWTRVSPPEGERYKIRVEQDKDFLVIERKIPGAVIAETLMASKEPGELVVVVQIAGSELDGVEFRRVYRAL